MKGAIGVAMQTIAVVETERLQQAWQGDYRAWRRVRQTKMVAGFGSIFRPPRLTRILCLPFYHVHRRDRGHGDHTNTHPIPFPGEFDTGRMANARIRQASDAPRTSLSYAVLASLIYFDEAQVKSLAGDRLDGDRASAPRGRAMVRERRVRWAIAVAGGLILGAVLGNAIGSHIRSDNLPFFDALGAIIGMGIGFTVHLVIEQRAE
jgi:hypothetical protein